MIFHRVGGGGGFFTCLLTFKSIINGFKIELLGFSDGTLEMAEHLRIHMNTLYTPTGY